MKPVSSILIPVIITFLATTILGQLIAPKAMDRAAVEALIEKQGPYIQDKAAIQSQLGNLNDRLDRIERKLDSVLKLP